MKLFKKKVSAQVPEVKMFSGLLDQVAHQRGNIDQEFPSDVSAAEQEAIKKVRAYTMTSVERLAALYRSVEYLEGNRIEGDMVECGVWKGGSMMLVANKLVERNNTHRKLFMFDTYEGMSSPTDNDKTFDNKRADDLLSKEEKNPENNNVWCYSTIDEVKANLHLTGYNSDNMDFIKGKVEDTLPYEKIGDIALLRLDTDWYESTRHELEILYDKLVVGGILIIDDYGHWNGARKAVDDFISNRKLPLHLTRVDYTCRLAIKLK